MSLVTVTLARGGEAHVQSSIADPDFAVLTLPRHCIVLAPDDVDALIDALVAHRCEFLARRPPTMADYADTEPF